MALVALGLFVPAAATEGPAVGTEVDQLIVRYEPGADPAAALAAADLDGTLTPGEELGGGLHTVVLAQPVPIAEAAVLAARLEQSSSVTSAEPDQVVSVPETTSAPEVRAQATQGAPPWGLDRIDQRRGLDGAYRYETTGAGVTAYVIDSGIRATHRDIAGRVAPGTGTRSDRPGSSDDCNGHGTHVAGILGGVNYGVAKRVTLVPVRVLDCAGKGSTSEVIAGINWVIGDHTPGAPAVATMSFGTNPADGLSPAVDAAVAALVADGVTVAVASGNSGVDACLTSPARAPEAITVSASTSGDVRAAFSNYGSCTDIYAPGEGVASAWIWSDEARTSLSDTASASANGTSMAAPHVAGVAARLLETSPKMTPAQVWARIAADATLVDALDVKKLLHAPAPPIASAGGTGFYLNNSFGAAADIYFVFGDPDDVILAGDWNGDGGDTFAVRRGNAFHVRNSLTSGGADRLVYYGDPGDELYVGDWDGDGVDTFAVRRGNAFHIKNTVSSGYADRVIYYGDAGDTILVGDWDGDGVDTFAVRRGNAFHIKNTLTSGYADRAFYYGDPGDKVLVGDWDGNATDTLGVQRSNWFHLRNSLTSGVADVAFGYGNPGDETFVGDWDGNGTDTLGVRRR
ncbi:MAG: S8 family peptidase [Georgenia sp.]